MCRDSGKGLGYSSWCKICFKMHRDAVKQRIAGQVSHHLEQDEGDPSPPSVTDVLLACRVCKVKKHEDEFTRDSQRPGGRESRCKACRRQTRLAGEANKSTEKLCPGCGSVKPAAEFKQKDFSLEDGRCKECVHKEASARPLQRVYKPTVTEKCCLSCQMTKPALEFTVDSRKKTGLGSRCKPCEALHCRLKRRKRKIMRQQQQQPPLPSEQGLEPVLHLGSAAPPPCAAAADSGAINSADSDVSDNPYLREGGRMDAPQALSGIQGGIPPSPPPGSSTQMFRCDDVVAIEQSTQHPQEPGITFSVHASTEDIRGLRDVPSGSGGGGNVREESGTGNMVAMSMMTNSNTGFMLSTLGQSNTLDGAPSLTQQQQQKQQQQLLSAGIRSAVAGAAWTGGQVQVKRCSRCHLIKPLAVFTRDSRRKFKVGCRCLPCEAEYAREKRRRKALQRQKALVKENADYLDMLINSIDSHDAAPPAGASAASTAPTVGASSASTAPPAGASAATAANAAANAAVASAASAANVAASAATAAVHLLLLLPMLLELMQEIRTWMDVL
ncbi:hypothetical protein CEUSTIGMA_g12268.t1 [Chlamydomonas eustigma]|uniref:Stc1 domain-containing protein n=1 Tax=Chlamydomonas eustigma TaxID=1157962 RepID=A0A250XP47_9CHLO|nr:hypothetical protein CEUSTIGMA_g12268.t1 [Chlamydomonas eustigma]|eukprot:GAX84847.1 hypothetical protein CEUSTIGMA_g12268.t1 [Chlamydomonas eustigma]